MMSSELHPFFSHSLYIQRTINNESLTWYDWLVVSSASKRNRDAVLALKSFQIFALGRLIIPKISSYSLKDRAHQRYIRLLRAQTGDFKGVLTHLQHRTRRQNPQRIAHYADLGLVLIKSDLDASVEKAKQCFSLGVNYHSSHFLLGVVKFYTNKGDEQSLKLASEFAKNIGVSHYSQAMAYIACASIKSGCAKAIQRAEAISKEVLPIYSLMIRCQIAMMQSSDYFQLITDYINQDPGYERLALEEMALWRFDQNDPDSVEDSVKICQLNGKCGYLINNLYRYAHEAVNNSQKIERLKNAIMETEHPFIESRSYIPEVVENLLQSTVNPQLIQALMQIYYHDHNTQPLLTLLENLSQLPISGVVNPMQFIRIMHEIIHPKGKNNEYRNMPL